MTPEQRETLKLMVERGGTQCGRMCGDYEPHEMDARRAALAPAPTCGTCEQLRAERDEARALHQELMFQVGNKYPGETRHETAKRYLREHDEHCGQGGPAYATEPTR